MENRLKILTILSVVEGAVWIIVGILADTIFPMMGWAHNPGFSAAQGFMILYGGYKVVLGISMFVDWSVIWN